MIMINGKKFYDEPTSCGACPFFFNGMTDAPLSQATTKGHCMQFDEMHNSWRNVPRRCEKIFRKAFTYSEGSELVITN